jgi:hypothetical protein
MPKYEITRPKPSPGMGETQLEKSVVEVPAGYPIPMGAVKVADSTPVAAFSAVSAAPELPAHEARTPANDPAPVSEEDN